MAGAAPPRRCGPAWNTWLLALAGLVGDGALPVGAADVLRDFPPKRYAYRQTVDHFSFGDSGSFEQRFWVYDGFWDRPVDLSGSRPPAPAAGASPSGPILFYLGGEGQVESFYSATSVLFESLGPALRALVVFGEHRYYGRSTIPPAHGTSRGRSGVDRYRYLSVEQALADYAELIVWIRRGVGCAEDGLSCPTFLFGGSYGGMLVGWFRLKYPHLSWGGVMSSAPVNFYTGQGVPRRFWANVMHTYRLGGGESCVSAVEASLEDLDRLPVGPSSMEGLARTFRVCEGERGDQARFLARLKLYIRGALAGLAMVDYPFPWKLLREMPASPVRAACEGLRRSGPEQRLAALNAAVELYVGDSVPCKCLGRELVSNATASPTAALARAPEDMDMEPWNFQACTELPLQPLTSDFLGFYPPDESQMEDLYQACRERFGGGLRTRPGFMPLTYGAGEVVERGSLSYTIIVDGDHDPWKTGRLVLRNASGGRGFRRHVVADSLEIITRGSLVQIEPIPGAAHHQDLIGRHAEDSPELVAARAAILAQLQAWAAGEEGTCWDGGAAGAVDGLLV